MLSNMCDEHAEQVLRTMHLLSPTTLENDGSRIMVYGSKLDLRSCGFASLGDCSALFPDPYPTLVTVSLPVTSTELV